jgi:pyruvate/2-oxoglutarate dehydrogenase complex dihydrolipoamide dehydrogenase (E3) component
MRDVMPETLPQLQPLDAFNTQLMRNARPDRWPHPEPRGRYNLVVLGGGTAGLVTAVGAAGLGARVAIVERDLLGGDCLNVGCVPSKALIRCARAAAEVRHAGRFGVQSGGEVRVDFAAVMERMRRLRAEISPNDSAERLRGLGVDVFFGEGRFVAEDALEVGDKRLTFARACVATGARASVPPIQGLSEAGCLTNETVFSLTALPARLAVIGGGPIGCELAQAFARFGAKTCLIEAGQGLLGREDRDAAAIVEGALRADGVEVLLDAQVMRVRKTAGAKVLVIKSAGGASREIEVDEILVGAGRAANVENIGLDRAKVAYGANGVQVDDRLRTTNPKIYAAGDVCLPFKFTHTADAAARIVIRNALFFGRQSVRSLVVPWCTYTEPEVAHVGLYAHEARERGIAVLTHRVHMSDVDRARLDDDSEGFLEVCVKDGSDEILGATMVGAHAGETISELTLAISAGVGLGKIAETIHCYPTQAEAIKKAADAHNRMRLTPAVKRAFRTLLALRR